MCKFSILIPAYKGKYLKECIESVLSQTYTDFELIILDDCSPEQIDTIVAEFNDSRIKFHKNETNVGAIDVVNNWNKLLGLSMGEYVICMGDDDKLLPICLEEYDKLIHKYPELSIYHGWTEIIDEHSNVSMMQEARPEYESVYSMIWHRWNVRKHQYIGDFLYNRHNLITNGGFVYFPLAWGSDDITAIVAAKNQGIANTQVPVFQYRENSLNITSTGNTKIKIIASIEEQEWIAKFLSEPPTEHTAKIFFDNITKQYESYYKKKRIYLIANELKNSSKFRWVCWVYRKKHYNLGFKDMLYALAHSLK